MNNAYATFVWNIRNTMLYRMSCSTSSSASYQQLMVQLPLSEGGYAKLRVFVVEEESGDVVICDASTKCLLLRCDAFCYHHLVHMLHSRCAFSAWPTLRTLERSCSVAIWKRMSSLVTTYVAFIVHGENFKLLVLNQEHASFH